MVVIHLSAIELAHCLLHREDVAGQADFIDELEGISKNLGSEKKRRGCRTAARLRAAFEYDSFNSTRLEFVSAREAGESPANHCDAQELRSVLARDHPRTKGTQNNRVDKRRG